MIQSAGMWWICDGELNIKCISVVSFTNKLHCNQDALFFFSKKFRERVDFNAWRYIHVQSNDLVLDFCNNDFGLKRQPTNSIWNGFL